MRTSFSRLAAGLVNLTLAACSSESGLDVDNFKEDSCTKPLLVDLAPASTVDAIAVRRPPGLRSGNVSQDTIATFGTPCATAVHAGTCNDDFSKAAGTAAWKSTFDGVDFGTAASYLVTSRGDAIEVISDSAALAAFLGPVDNLAKARLVATLYGYDGACKMNAIEDGYEAFEERNDCSIGKQRFRLMVHRDATLTVAGYDNLEKPTCVDGRRPEGLVVREAAMDTPGDVLAEMAHLEAAAVVAFERLALDLARLGAPIELVRRASEAADDERRHARAMSGLARSRGAKLRAVEVTTIADRSTEAVAMENVVEGCVRETYGAVVASWQARKAADLDVRRAMGSIARDECIHADLSLDVHTWAMTTLDHAGRERVRRAEQQARGELYAEVEAEIATDLVVHLGLPSRAQARALLVGLHGRARAA